MPTATFELFRKAIAEKKQVVCTYDRFTREVCPHALGYKDGKEHVLTFQFAGGSKSGLSFGGQWRCFEIRFVQNALLREGSWHTGPRHTRPNSCVDSTVIEVAY